MRVLGATRLSRDTDVSTSIERQREAIERYAQSHGHTIVAITEDVDVSGSVSPFDRMGLGPWLNGRSGQWDIIVTAKLDRISRSVVDFGTLLEWCRGNGKTLVCLDPNIDLTTDWGQAMANVLMTFAQLERKMIARRVADSRIKTRSNGQWTGGRVPYGYKVQDAGSIKVLVPNPPEQKIIERAAGMVISGSSVTAVCRAFNAEEIPSQSGRQWTTPTLIKVLRNPIIRGYVTHKGEIVYSDDGEPVSHEPLIDDDTWTRLQAALDANASPGSGVRSNAALLLQVAFCAHCNAPMYARARNDRDYGYYECKTRRTGGKCPSRSIRQNVLEDILGELLLNAIGDREIPRVKIIPAISHTAELAKIEVTVADLDDQFAAGVVPASSYGRMMTRLEARRVELASLPQRDEQTLYEPSGQTVAEHWAGLDSDGRSRFLRQWGVRLWIFAEGHEPTIGGIRGIQYLLKSGIETDPEIARAFGLTQSLYVSARDGFGLIA